MQISIVIPEFIQPFIEWINYIWILCISWYDKILSTSFIMMISSSTLSLYNYIKSLSNNEIFLPFIMILLFCWPFILSMLMSLLYASSWILWIITSMLLGSIQVIYVLYQFIMISADIFGLSMLKSYSVLRSTAFYYIEIFTTITTNTIMTSNTGYSNKNNTIQIRYKSRRRLWKEKLDQAGCYENFLKIRIETKDVASIVGTDQGKNHQNTIKQQSIDSALPSYKIDSTSEAPIINAPTSSLHQQEQHQQRKQGGYEMFNSTKGTHFLKSPSNTNSLMRRVNSFSSMYQHRSTPSLDEQQSSYPMFDDHIHSSSPILDNNDNNGIRPRRNLSFSLGDKSPFEKQQQEQHDNPNHHQSNYIDPIIAHELGEKMALLLTTTMGRLKDARITSIMNSSSSSTDHYRNNQQQQLLHSNTGSSNVMANNIAELSYLLSAVIKRNHLTLDDILIENARSVAEYGRYGLSNQSRQLIRAYYEEVQKGLDWIADAPLLSSSSNSTTSSLPTTQHNAAENHDDNNSYNNDNLLNDHSESSTYSNPQISHRQSWNQKHNIPTSLLSSSSIDINIRRQMELSERITLVRKMKQNMGRTALMFSGGGAQAMYHLGVIRALIESKLYNDITVISGTSGGSIAAGMCAIKTPEELYNDVCVSTVSTDYMLNGKMKKENIRWFPTMFDMITYWFKNRVVVDTNEFNRTCEFYYNDITFEEAFQRTGKHVCITVSASRASDSSTAQRLLLNHISTPNVTIASAVRASCALPGVMLPAKLMIKNSDGTLEPFEVDGVEWIDGSVQADLPFQRIATLFAVTSFIVSQTNFHILPFINKNHHPNSKSFYWRLFQTLEWDIRNRALKLSRLGLFPRIFGQDISKVFKQRYHGNLTIVPRFTTMQTFGLKILSNPTVKDMEGYLKYSQIAMWPYLNVIRDMVRLEKSLEDCLTRLENRMRALVPDWAYYNDDIESIASGSAMAYSNNTNHNYHYSSFTHNIGNNNSVGGSRLPPTSRSLRIIAKHSSFNTGHDPDADRMKRRIDRLEHENQDLREQLETLKTT